MILINILLSNTKSKNQLKLQTLSKQEKNSFKITHRIFFYFIKFQRKIPVKVKNECKLLKLPKHQTITKEPKWF